MTKHAWVRAPREEWKEMDKANPTFAKNRPGYFDVGFHCDGCGSVGHIMYKDGDLPESPEEAMSGAPGNMIDPTGSCEEQLVENVHAH